MFPFHGSPALTRIMNSMLFKRPEGSVVWPGNFSYITKPGRIPVLSEQAVIKCSPNEGSHRSLPFKRPTSSADPSQNAPIHQVSLRVWAFIATITVLMLISAAPNAGVRMMP